MKRIDLIDYATHVGYGENDGAVVMGLKFVAPDGSEEIGISWTGEELEKLLSKIKPVANIKVATHMPPGVAPR